MPRKKNDTSMPQGIRANRCQCGDLVKVKEAENISDKFGMKFFICANYDYDAPASTTYLRPLVCCKKGE
jgi:hypothetical protein